MNKVESVKKLQLGELVKKNIPFVLFCERESNPKIVIQTSPLNMNGDVHIKEKGFYIFPFSDREQTAPLFLKPDYVALWSEFSALQIDFPELKAPFIEFQNLHQVSKDEYVKDLEKFIATFESNKIKKTIYSRIHKENLNENLDLERFFDALVSSYPKAFVYILNVPGDGLWIGASPELLLSFENGKAHTIALAGTLKINENLPAPAWTNKEIDEHQLVEQHIISLCEDLGIKYSKSLVRSSNTGKVFHLKSDFTLKINAEQIVDFLRKLHPTPAISGLPQQKALDLIYSTEKHERSYYSGFLGWVDDVHNFNFYINLRCMKLIDKQCYFFAGGGITPDSEISKEWEETKLKMSTLMDVLPENVVTTLQ